MQNFLTYETYCKRIEELNSNYWREGREYRWEYMSYVIDMLKIMDAVNIVEAGSSRMPLCSGSKLVDYPDFDLNETPFKNKNNKFLETYCQEFGSMTTKPGNFLSSARFDAFVALQTWEHLDKQADAFKEVMRISKAAILSFPYLWKHGDDRHRGIDKKKIAEWTCGVEPVHVHQIKNRIVYVWRFA